MSMAEFSWDAIPDWGGSAQSWESASDWLIASRHHILQSQAEAIDWDSVQILANPGVTGGASVFGRYSDSLWRKWVLGLFLADGVSYSLPSDQVEFDRLVYLTSVFPEGFSLAVLKIAGQWWPIGYTGWYPMSPGVFEMFENRPGTFQDRRVLPVPRGGVGTPLLYLFNYSVAPCLKKTRVSRVLMQRYAETIAAQTPIGLAAITVSEEGSRVARRFGMSQTGEFTIGTETERVFVGRISRRVNVGSG